MTMDKWVETHIGKGTDYDGAYGVQCVDLIKSYLKDVFDISAGSWGNAKYYWIDFDKHQPLKANFKKISNTPSFVPQKGDIVVWQGDINNGCGHVAIATGEGDTHNFYSYDQNWNGKPMQKIKHSYNCVYGVLRPNDQSKVVTPKPTNTAGSFPTPVKWQNGSTSEPVYCTNDLKNKIGSLNAKESALCYSKAGNALLVVYILSGTSKHKAGFVSYSGGVTKAPPQSKTWKNGSTSETVYSDTAKRSKVGYINPYGTAYCLGKIDGMFLVLYQVTGTKIQKCGFVDYNGGC